MPTVNGAPLRAVAGGAWRLMGGSGQIGTACAAIEISNVDLLHDLQPVAVEAHHAAGGMLQQPDFLQAERGQDLGADPIVAQVGRPGRARGGLVFLQPPPPPPPRLPPFDKYPLATPCPPL